MFEFLLLFLNRPLFRMCFCAHSNTLLSLLIGHFIFMLFLARTSTAYWQTVGICLIAVAFSLFSYLFVANVGSSTSFLRFFIMHFSKKESCPFDAVWSEFPWENFTPQPCQTLGLLHGGQRATTCVRVHGKGELGEPPLQKWVFRQTTFFKR